MTAETREDRLRRLLRAVDHERAREFVEAWIGATRGES